MRNLLVMFSAFLTLALLLSTLVSCSGDGGSDFVLVPRQAIPAGGDDGGGGGGGTMVTPTTITITGAPTGTANGAFLSGNISVAYTLTNPDAVSTDIMAEFSINGLVFDPMTEGVGSDGTSNLTSSAAGEAHTFVWNSAVDLPSSLGPTAAIFMRLSATATGSTTTNTANSSSFDVNNNLGIPTVTVDDPATTSGTILITYTLADSDGDLMNITPEFSTNDGTSYTIATQGSGGDGVTGLTPGMHTFAWQSAADIPTASTMVRFRISPFDAETGVPGENATTSTVDNTTLPTATITTAGGATLTGDATIAVTFTDATGSSPTTSAIEFSTNGGVSFSPCTPAAGSGFDSTTDLFASLGVSLDFIWDTATDIPAGSGVVTGVIFRVTPIEGTTDGVPDSITNTVDNTGGGGGGFVFLPGTDQWQINITEDDDASGTADFIEGLGAASSGTNPSFDGDVSAATDAFLSQLNVYYRNNADGSPAGGGIPMSFQTADGAGSAPAPSTSTTTFGVDDFSSMAIRNILHIPAESGSNNPVGVAFFTAGGNTSIENNSQQAGANPELGVFIDRNNFFWNTTGFSAGQRTLSEYMKFLGQVTAHEIGHSIDRSHTSAAPPTASNNIMAASSTVGPGITFDFDAASVTNMLTYMPGPSRCCNEMGLTPLQFVRSSDLVVVGKRVDSNNPLEFQIIETLYGTANNSTISIHQLNAGHPIYQQSEETLFIACLKEIGNSYQVVFGEAGLFAVENSEKSIWTSVFANYGALLERKQEATFRRELLAQIKQDLMSANDTFALNAMFDLMQEKQASEIDLETQQYILDLAANTNASFKERNTAVQVLTLVANPNFEEALYNIGLNAPNQLLQAIAGALESSVGTKIVATELQNRMAGLTSEQKEKAAILLGWQKEPASVATLVSLLEDSNIKVAIAAANALGKVGEPSSLALLQNAIRSKTDVTLRKHLYRSVGQLETVEAQHWLRQESYRNQDPRLQDVIRFADRYAKTMDIR